MAGKGKQTARAAGKPDYLILGGGSAGATLAARLSEDPDIKVVLVEAGSDLASEGLPAPARDIAMRTIFKPEYFRPPIMLEHPGGPPGTNSKRVAPSLQAMTLGGGSFVNGMQAVRGLRRDFDEWEDRFGIKGWAYQDVLPYFVKIENDLNCNGAVHGKDGPITIQRIKEDRWSAFTNKVRDSFRLVGMGPISDMNDGASTVGFGAVPMNFSHEGRMSTANAYLTPEVRRRPNLSIVTGTEAIKLGLRGRTVDRAHLRDAQGEYEVASDNIVLCCGALISPTLLMRSGIGAGVNLRASGIEVMSDRPGVGQNLKHHAALSINVHLKYAARVKGALSAPCPMVVRYSSGEPGCKDNDMYLYVWERATGSSRHDLLGRQLATLMLQLNSCHSTGEVGLRPDSPNGDPSVRTNLLGDERDSHRMVRATRDLLEMVRQRPLAPVVNEALFVRFTPLLRKTMEESRQGWLLNHLAAIVLGGPATIRRTVLARMTDVIDGVSYDALAQKVHDYATSSHFVGTCRLGDPADRHAVVDTRCRVIEVDGLRVVDASILPMLSVGGPALPIIMAAERAAAMMKEDRR